MTERRGGKKPTQDAWVSALHHRGEAFVMPIALVLASAYTITPKTSLPFNLHALALTSVQGMTAGRW